jgi:hypothetical protein
MANKG